MLDKKYLQAWVLFFVFFSVKNKIILWKRFEIVTSKRAASQLLGIIDMIILLERL